MPFPKTIHTKATTAFQPTTTNYEILTHPDHPTNNLNDILQHICFIRGWNCQTEQQIAEKIEYHYGDGQHGLIRALYNSLPTVTE